MVKKAMLFLFKVIAEFDFMYTSAVILFTLLSIHITSKTLDLEMYLESPLIIYCSDGLHFPITIAYIFFCFFSLCTLCKDISSGLSPTFSVWRVSSLRILLIIHACVFPQNPCLGLPYQLLCTQRLLHV